MNHELLYPYGKKKALIFSYDDGQIYDRQLVEMFDRYGLKATFHLNSGSLDKEGFIAKNEVKSLYQNHEVACHGVAHRFLRHLSKEGLVREVWEDRRVLENIMKKPITGFSYAFGEYNDSIVTCFKNLGIKYSRTVQATYKFQIPDNFLEWKPTCHHEDALLQRAEEFLHTPDYCKLPLFFIWGHSFEFERNHNWKMMEEACERLANQENIWYTTSSEYYSYVEACKNLIYNVEGNYVYNSSCIAVWMKTAREIVILEPGETIVLT